ncbi:MAG: hypothetical protein COA96_10330 [SAR86 cluster bacterium]|uniref:Uncharacterized protein n=1 Tax=SAR86 cluster bacterium TaxID=2030880 RepID=A0A2A5AXW5_9GAMM|nr:MAG: hypothetical protein COA96_10330 [SAR86 cluster bacterium]
MSDAPKKLWIDPDLIGGYFGGYMSSSESRDDLDYGVLYHHADTVKALTAERDDLIECVDGMETALQRIEQWASAYPTSVFPEVDSKWLHEAHQTLVASGKNIDRISANVARHSLKGVGDIARGALPTPPKDTP